MLATVVAVWCLAFASPALAQDESETEPAPDPTGVTVFDDGEAAQPESGIVRDDDTSDTVRRIRRDLVIVAGVMSVGLGVYVWHTSPSRRVRLATQRAGIGRHVDEQLEDQVDQEV